MFFLYGGVMTTEAVNRHSTAPATLLERLNAACDRTRERLGLSSDQDMARHLGVSPKTVSFWRNGRWTDADRALISILINPPDVAESS
jgi:DNA-binding transcriptional regulator YiaG